MGLNNILPCLLLGIILTVSSTSVVGVASYRSVPTIHRADHYDASDMAKRLYKATKGFGTDEDALIQILTSVNGNQRQNVRRAYNSEHRTHSLTYKVSSETSGTFKKGLLALIQRIDEYTNATLRTAIKDSRTNLMLNVLIAAGRPNTLEDSYSRLFHASLAQELRSKFSSKLYDALLKLLTSRPSARVDHSKARLDAKKLSACLKSPSARSRDNITSIFMTSTLDQLGAVVDAYCGHTSTGCDMYTQLGRVFSADVEAALSIRAKYAQSRLDYLAEAFYKAIRAKDDNILIFLSTTRAEIDLGSVIQSYQQRYKSSLADDFVKLSGHKNHYKDLFLAILRGN